MLLSWDVSYTQVKLSYVINLSYTQVKLSYVIKLSYTKVKLSYVINLSYTQVHMWFEWPTIPIYNIMHVINWQMIIG